MELTRGNMELEALVKELNDDARLLEYKKPYDNYKTSWFPRMLGTFLVWSGNLVYGKKPSYLKFRAVEVIARVPYHSWESATYTMLTMFYRNEHRAIELSCSSRFARIAQDNETMHVVVISHLARKEQKANFIIHTLIPLLFAFFYFWASYVLYLIKPRYSLELNYLFENHAFEQYSWFIRENEEELKKKSAECEFLQWYGREVLNQYELFRSIRNDEIIHRNRSIREIEMLEEQKRG